jgi:hypothetical protein
MLAPWRAGIKRNLAGLTSIEDEPEVHPDGRDVAVRCSVDEIPGKRLLGSGRADDGIALRSDREPDDLDHGASGRRGIDPRNAGRLEVAGPRGLSVRMTDIPALVEVEQRDEDPPVATRAPSGDVEIDDAAEPGQPEGQRRSDERVAQTKEAIEDAERDLPEARTTGVGPATIVARGRSAGHGRDRLPRGGL